MPYQSHPPGAEALNFSFMEWRSDTTACWQALLMPSGQAGLQGHRHTGYSLSCASAMSVLWLDDRGASSILKSSAVTELLTNPSLCCHPQPLLQACVCWVLQSKGGLSEHSSPCQPKQSLNTVMLSLPKITGSSSVACPHLIKSSQGTAIGVSRN